MAKFWKCFVMFSFAFSMVICEQPVWPDWRCHPGYAANTKNEIENGHAGMLYLMEHCSVETANHSLEFEQDGIENDYCYKWCMLESTAILKLGSIEFELADQSKMEDKLLQFFFFDGENESAKYISSRVVSMCGEKVKNSINVPCEEKNEVYECLEDAWKCQ